VAERKVSERMSAAVRATVLALRGAVRIDIAISPDRLEDIDDPSSSR
jgi:hypothetical protein